MTQNEMILMYLENFDSITPIEAIEQFGCTRLSARIFDLRKQGTKIGSELVKNKNRFGKIVHYSKYFLIKE